MRKGRFKEKAYSITKERDIKRRPSRRKTTIKTAYRNEKEGNAT